MSTEDQPTGSVAKTGKKYLAGFLVASAALVAVTVYAYLQAPQTATAADVVTVYKTPTCGCCGDWVDHLVDAGLNVEVINVDSTQTHRAEAGVPNRLGSCHTAVVAGYFVEGHVPADLVQGLIARRPENIRGIAVPGMPLGSPGMEGPNPVEYDVLALDTSGNVFVYATRQGASSPDGH